MHWLQKKAREKVSKEAERQISMQMQVFRKTDELFSGRMEEEEVKDGSFNSRKWTPDCESDWHSRSITLLLLENSAKTYCF